MIILGTPIADLILAQTKERITRTGIVPHLVIVQTGTDQGSQSYIRQKAKAAAQIGAQITIKQYPARSSYQSLSREIQSFASDPGVHGIILQRPLVGTLPIQTLMKLIPLPKDVDGFRKKTPFVPPVGQAILHLLMAILWEKPTDLFDLNKRNIMKLAGDLRKKRILLIGRGETGGKPVARTLSDARISFLIATSVTPIEEFMPESDIIISAVGKPDIVQPKLLKPGAIVLSVGMHRTEAGTLVGDFDENAVDRIASYYTPTPGGVGPVNVACLMKNLAQAADFG